MGQELAAETTGRCDRLLFGGWVYWAHPIREVLAVVYLDLVILLNFLVDFLLLLGANQLAGFPPQPGRAALAAALGAAYAGVCLLPGFFFLASILWRTVSLALMGMIAFGINLSAIRRTAAFVLLSMALGGIAMGVNGNDMGMLLLCCGGLWLLCRFGFQDGIGQQQYVPVELSAGDRHISVLALRDTGNTLKDPLTGEQVLVAGAQIGNTLLGLTQNQLRNPVETLASGLASGFRLIPYHSVGKSEGMLLAYRFRRAKIGNTYSDPLVAFAPEEIGRGDVYQMLTGGAI